MILSRWEPDQEEVKFTRNSARFLKWITITDLKAPNWWKRLQEKFPRAAEVLWRAEYKYPSSTVAHQELTDAVKSGAYDAVIFRYMYPLIWSLPYSGPPIFVDIDDTLTELHSTNERGRFKSRMAKWALRRQACRLDRLQRRVLQKAAHVWVTKETDLASVPHSRCSILPNIPFDLPEEPLPSADESWDILFVGTLAYLPNRAGLDWFLSRVWGVILKELPEVRLLIVGNGLLDWDAQRWKEYNRVNPIGFVDDLAAAYRGAAFTICPLDRGAGTKIKVLESLGFGRTCVVSPHGLTGFEQLLHHNESVMLANNEETFASSCISLLKNVTLRNRMAETGSRIVRSEFSPDRFAERVIEPLEKILEKGPQ